MDSNDRHRFDRKSLFEWLVISQVWAFLLAVPELMFATGDSNRYFLHWSHQLALVRLGAIVAVGLAIFAVGCVLRRCPRKEWTSLAAISGFVVLGLLYWSRLAEVPSTLARDLLLITRVGLLAVGVLAGLRWRMNWTLQKWAGWMATCTLIIAPVVPVYWIHAFRQATYAPVSVPSLADASHVDVKFSQSTPPASDNVYLFVFDGWPYRLTIERGAVLDDLPNLREIAGDMCLFTDAHSPGCHTSTSMPRLLFQRSDRFALRRGEVGFWDNEFYAAEAEQNLFSRARDRGYRTYMVGWYHPYHAMLGDSVDFVRSIAYYDHLGEGAWQRARAFYWMSAIRLFGKRVAEHTIGDYMVVRNYALVRHVEELVAYTNAVLDDPRPGQFAVFHLPVPHWPFCLSCTDAKPLDVAYGRTSTALAREQLVYMDRLVGQLVAKLKASGKYDISTIIMTSDHTWRYDPALTEASARNVTHVPLLIKFPGQKSAVRIESPFSNTRLGQLIEASRSPDFSPSGLVKTIRAGNFYEGLDDVEITFKYPLAVQ